MAQGAVGSWLGCWVTNPGVPFSKPLDGSMINSLIHHSNVNQMSSRNLWRVSG